MFGACKNLTDVFIPNTITSIGEYAFANCDALVNINIPQSVNYIGKSAFSNCDSLKSIVIPNGVTVINDWTFGHCKSLQNVTLPNGITEIKSNGFSYCGKLTSIDIPDTVTTIGNNAFYRCDSLTSVTIPRNVKSIGEWAFATSINLNSVNIYGKADISDWAFACCENMKTVNIINGANSLGNMAFGRCKNLTSVNILTDINDIKYDTFSENPKLTIYSKYGTYIEKFAKNNNIPFKLYEGNINTAYASTQTVYVDNEKVEFQMYALKDANGNPTNYIKLRDLAYVLNDTAAKFNVTWNGQINIKTNTSYEQNGSEMKTPYSGNQKYSLSEAVTNINNIPAQLEAIVIKDNQGGSYTYYKLRDLGKSIGFYVGWSSEKGIYLETNKKYQ